MATKLYLHDASNALSGQFPTGEQASVFPAATATDANTLRTMDTDIGAAQASLACSTSGTTSTQSDFMGFFCSPFLSGAQTVGGGSMVFNMGSEVSNAQANAWINAINIYVWTPSAGTKRGTILDSAGASLGSSEKTSGAEYSIYITGIGTSEVSAQDGDVVICEIWGRFTQGMTSSYVLTLYYDGATETNSDGTLVSDHASYIQLNENLTFQGTTTTTSTSTSTTSTSTSTTSTSTSTTSTSTSTSTTSTSTSTTSTSTSTTTSSFVNRFFAYNTGTTIPDTVVVGDLAVSTNTTDIIGSSSQVKWWAGPSEQLGYVIAYSVSARNHPTQWGNIAEVGFKRSDGLSDQSLLDRINAMRRDQSLSEFGVLADGLAWLDSLNMWYSYGK